MGQTENACATGPCHVHGEGLIRAIDGRRVPRPEMRSLSAGPRGSVRLAWWLAAGLVCGLGWSSVVWSRSAPEPAKSQQARVSHVIDGDTIELTTGQRVRYVGIDTPERFVLRESGWVLRPEPFAEEARAYNREAVEGRTVRLEFDVERRDRFHRCLAYVYRGERFINAELVQQGLATVKPIPPNTRHARLFRRLERDAREDHRGLWAVPGARR